MKIIHLVPGSGGSFYCQNCVRDGILIQALRRQGHDVVLVPLYLPLFDNAPDESEQNAPVFYGAVNIYLSQKLPGARRLPAWIRRWLDSSPVLKAAAALAGATRSEDLTDLTLSMLEGGDGRQARELEQLVSWLQSEGPPDIIHFSNALLLGMAARLRESLKARLVCSLQDEDVWLNPMPAWGRERALALLRSHAGHVDAFVSPSQYYAKVAGDLFHLPAQSCRVIPPALNLNAYEPAEDPQPPVIGFLSRLSESSGLDHLVEAFLSLREDPALAGLRLHLCGGSTADDRAFLKQLFGRIRRAGAAHDVQVFRRLDQRDRVAFLKGLSVMSAPCPGGEAFGLQIAEAMASGVPCVQPNVGAYPELIDSGSTGIVYSAASNETLIDALRPVLSNPDLRGCLRQHARSEAWKRFRPERYAKDMAELYFEITQLDS